MNLIVTNSADKNLLDPATDGHYNKEEIRIYYLTNGVKEEVFHANQDAPRNFSIFNQDGEYFMNVSVNTDHIGRNETKETTTFIQWNDHDEDTVVCTVNRTVGKSDMTTVRKIWFNGKLMYDIQANKPATIGNGTFDKLLQIKK